MGSAQENIVIAASAESGSLHDMPYPELACPRKTKTFLPIL